MKRQSAISAFFSPASKRVLEANVPGESSEDRIDMQQVAISSNIDNKSSVPSTDVTDPALENIIDEDRNRSTALPVSFDSSTLPKVMPSHEGCTLQREWFTEFAWLCCNQDGTCHCSCCLWASKNNQLSAKNTEGIHKSRWAKETNGWQDYRKGKSALHSHNRSPWHQAATDALQVCMYDEC